MPDDVSLPVITPDGRPWEQQPRWRRDFPIDVPEDNHVARRDFTKFMVLTSLAFVVGQVWIGLTSLWRRRHGRFAEQWIARAAEVPPGKAVPFAYPTAHDPCVLVRTTGDQWVAYGSKCTHLSCAVLPDVEAGVLRCPCHHGYFDLASGRPVAGPPRRPLPQVLIEVRNGEVYATGVQERST